MASFMKVVFVMVIAWMSVDNRIAVDERVSVVFPESPEKNTTGDQVYYMYSSDAFVYNAAFTDLKQISHEKASTSEQQNRIYEGFIKGALAAAKGARLLAKRDFYIRRYRGKEVTYTKHFNGKSDVKIVKRILLINRRLYQFEIWALSGQMDVKRSSAFFDSVQIRA